jgi:hypothetical protein
MVHCDSSTAAISRSLDGVRLNTNALLGVTGPERALVLLARGREDNRGGRGKGTMIYAHTLRRLGQRPQSGRLTAGARRQPRSLAGGSPPGHDRLQGAAA